MSVTVRRNLVRLAEVGLTALGLCLAAGPASAAAPAGGTAVAGSGADLAVSITGTTLAANSPGKDANVTIVNNGRATATEVKLSFDVLSLDTGVVRFEVRDTDACDADIPGPECDVIDIAPGQALDIAVRLTRVPGSGTGDAGVFTASTRHSGGDADPGPNSATARVAVGAGGPDLFVYAPDAPFDPDTNATSSVPPGGTTKLRYAIGNFGDAPVSGLRLVIKLPHRVSFAGSEPNCGYDAARSTATCTYRDMPLVPADGDTSDRDRVYSMVTFYNVIKVAAGTPVPGRLAGGEVSVEAIAAGVPVPQAGAGGTPPPALPGNAVGGSARQLAGSRDASTGPGRAGTGDVDATDNTDEFVVYVDRAAAPDHHEAGLPITGSRPGPTGLFGLASLVVGVLLVVATRRRTPGVAEYPERDRKHSQ